MTVPAKPTDLESILASLPSEEPPEHLWPRILETRGEVVRARRRRLAYAGSALALVAASLMLALLPAAPPLPAELAELQARGQLLEERVFSYASAGGRLSPAVRTELGEVRAAIMAVDTALADAYAGDRSAGEITALWQQRVALLDRLLATYATHFSGAQAI